MSEIKLKSCNTTNFIFYTTYKKSTSKFSLNRLKVICSLDMQFPTKLKLNIQLALKELHLVFGNKQSSLCNVLNNFPVSTKQYFDNSAKIIKLYMYIK